MQHRFEQFIKANDLIAKGDRVLVAVSGGVDSVVLLELLISFSHSIAIAHCNFCLRGTESDGDEAFVSELSNKYDLPFYSKKFNTATYAKEHGISIQLAARQLRYDWFHELLPAENYDKIATAHHASDQVETILYNQIKGSGIAGLRGIPLINGNVIRPLLFASRDEIEKFALSRQLKWREDSSNNSDLYSRNYLRHHVIPAFRKINPSLEETFMRNSTRISEIEAFVVHHTNEIKARYLHIDKDKTVLRMDWVEAVAGSAALLDCILSNYGFNYQQVLNIQRAHQLNPGAKFYSGNCLLICDREQLVITNLDEEVTIDLEISNHDEWLQTPWYQLHLEYSDKETMEIEYNINSAFIDVEKLKYPLKLRQWKHGDRFVPLGMKTQKKLSDFMIDEKIPLNLKGRVLLIESDNKIVWVVGHRLDDRFKLTESTSQILKISKIAADA